MVKLKKGIYYFTVQLINQSTNQPPFFESTNRNSTENYFTDLFGKVIGIDVFVKSDPGKTNLFNTSENTVPDEPGGHIFAYFPFADTLLDNLQDNVAVFLYP